MIFTDITSDMGSVIAAEWVSNWSCSFLAELERKKQKANQEKPKKKKNNHFTLFPLLFPEETNTPLVSKEPGQVNAKKSVVQYKQFNCVINNQ